VGATPTRLLAVQILNRFDQTGAYINKVLAGRLKQSGLSERDRALVTELVNGTLRWRGKLRWYMSRLIPGKLGHLPAAVRNILEISLYQLLYTSRIPEYAILHEAVELAKQLEADRWAKLINGVLRSFLREYQDLPLPDIHEDPVLALAVRYSHPQWMVKRWIQRYGVEEAEKLCRANNERPGVFVRVNRLRADRQQIVEMFQQKGIPCQPSPYLPEFLRVEKGGAVEELSAFKEGLFSIQDVSAGLVIYLLDPGPEEVILDMCAAPGGKTCHAAEFSRNGCTLIAMDKSRGRLALVQENCRRLGIKGVRYLAGDGANIWLRQKPDKILIDAPCSGLGVLSKRPDLRWRRRPSDIQNMRRLQQALLAQAAELVRPGGCIVYSTCTLEPEENEELIEDFLKAHPEFEIEEASGFVPAEVATLKGFIYTFPHRHGMDGSFAVRLRRGQKT